MAGKIHCKRCLVDEDARLEPEWPDDFGLAVLFYNLRDGTYVCEACLEPGDDVIGRTDA